MAGIACRPVRVVGGVDLRKIPRLGDIGLMTADAKDTCVQLGGCYRRWVVSVFCLRSMAALASHALVHALIFEISNIRVAGFADLMTGIAHRAGRDFSNGVRTVVSVTAKAVRHQESPRHHKEDESHQERCCQSKEVPCIFQDL